MKKIGIITYQNTTNYGAVFQMMALQKFISNKDVVCEIIDYRNETLEDRYSINPFKAKSIKELIKRLVYLKNNIIVKITFKKFIRKNIKISRKIYTKNNIEELTNQYDMFISGSDQVWNLKLSGNDYNYFLSFCEEKRKNNSYAASFGLKDLNSETKDKIKKYIDNFCNISVREESGIKIVNSINKNIDVSQNIDPVFLLTKEEWEMLSNKEIKEKYIVVYQVAETKGLQEFARKLSKKTGLKILFITSNNKKMKGAINKKCESPEYFLSYIKNAEYVVTTSFHGFALSIIFNKKVFYDVPNDLNSFGTRLESLASILSLKNRNISLYEKELLNSYEDDIEYDKVNKIIAKEREKSSSYLDKILK